MAQSKIRVAVNGYGVIGKRAAVGAPFWTRGAQPAARAA
jgi:hypothetical protein